MKLDNLSSPFLALLKDQNSPPIFTDKVRAILIDFYYNYSKAINSAGLDLQKYEPILVTFLALIKKQLAEPFHFQSFHRQITEGFDYYQFGLDFIRPLVDYSKSKLFHLENVAKIKTQLKSQHNVILFANHQTEVDPQLISLLLENDFPQVAKEMIFIAGHRVTSDPLAVPFSLGRNLICIYSKKHIDLPPEQREAKLLHNQQALSTLGKLLQAGGYCVYVAPSGGRDRKNEKGEIEIASFDYQSLEMIQLIANRSKRPTHYYPLTLDTYEILPPPSQVEKELGESRPVNFAPVQISFGNEIDMEALLPASILDKRLAREYRAQQIWQSIEQEYRNIVRN